MSKTLSSILHASQIVNVVGGTSGQLHYQSAVDTTAFVPTGTTGQILISNGNTSPSWISVLPANNGGTGLSTIGANGQALVSNGNSLLWSTIVSGAAIVNDVSTNNSYYPMWSTSSSGTPTTVYTSNTKLYFNPSTGTLNATIFNSLSDENQKTEIKIITSAQDIVNQITGVEFVWKDNGKRSAGVIAQELEKILPSLVDTNENSIKSVNYNGIIAYLIQTVKELDNRIKVLENK